MDKNYFNELDKLRFLAAAVVFFDHFGNHTIKFLSSEYRDTILKILTILGGGGQYGVSFFFVLSGFLISYLLCKEREKKGKISFKNFMIRRTLRIWPLYYVSLILFFFILPSISSFFSNLPFVLNANSLINFMMFIGNYDLFISNTIPNNLLGAHWSLSVEEQFYFTLPILFTFFKNSSIKYISLLFIIISFFYRIYFRMNYDTISVCGDLFLGVFLGILFFNNKEINNKYLSKFNTLPIRLLLLFILITYLMYLRPIFIICNLPFDTSIKRIIDTLLFSVIIYCTSLNAKNVVSWKINDWMNNMGKVSYGIYVLHMIPIYFTENFLTKKLNLVEYLIYMLICLGLVIAMSLFSYNVLEKRFLEMKKRFQ